MECCDWDTFETGFIAKWHEGTRRTPPPSTLLIDWKRAKRDWKRYGMTGAEAAHMQKSELTKEGEYAWSSTDLTR